MQKKIQSNKKLKKKTKWVGTGLDLAPSTLATDNNRDLN